MNVGLDHLNSTSEIVERALALISAAKGSSLLFAGDNKPALIEAATILAKRINCTAVDEHCDNTCPSCIKITKNQHPDVNWIEPKGTSGKIKIEDIRTFKEKIQFKPYDAHKKVFILRDAERLTNESANAILKILEEPPADAVIILVASSPSQLLPTVVSRCHLIRQISKPFSSVGDDAISNMVGRFLESDDYEQQRMLIDDMSALERSLCEQILQELVCVFRDILFSQLEVDVKGYMSAQSKTFISRWAGRFDTTALGYLIDEVLQTKTNIKGNANIKLSIDLLIKKIGDKIQ